MSEPFKLEGYEQTEQGKTRFKKSVELGGKKYKLKADIATGAITLISDGTEFATLDLEKGTFVSSDKNDEDVQKLFTELKGEKGIKKQLDDLKKQVVENVKTIQNTILEDDNNERSDSGITKEIFDKEKRDEVLGKNTYSTTENEEPKTELNVSEIVDSLKISPENKTTRGFGSLYYPSTLSKNTQNQDIIKFTVGTYKPKKLSLNGNQELGILSGNSSFNNESSAFSGKPTEIFLPIQPSITDSNIVDWNENRLDPIQAGLLQSGVTIMDKGGSGVERTIEQFRKTFKNNPQLLNAGKLLLAQEAAGAQNVLSRFGGGIVNPNLELLFNGPQLRPFNFSFRLSPRHKDEATQVRTIIRAFKESMAVKKSTGLFLVAPNVFKIEYLRKKDGEGYDPHPSLNRIKTCALKSCAVDYTPENSYATYNDSSNTMVSYNMTLQFQELEPVTDADYNDKEILDNHIGY